MAYPGLGRTATPAEVAAWDIDVRPDFKGLPKGAGTVAQGQVIWEAQCASCHGVFGESNQVFSPLVGGTTAADTHTGRVARLTDTAYPGRTTLMKLSTLSSLWDYINRAMPWTAPKSLTANEVYAVTAYLLNLGNVVPDDFSLSFDNMAQVQALLPNRNGMSTAHALWPGAPQDGMTQGQYRPDVAAPRCMSRCAGEPTVASFLPAHARQQHGNLATQNRWVGAQTGVTDAADAPADSPKNTSATAATLVNFDKNTLQSTWNMRIVLSILKQSGCTACHGMSTKIVGPAFSDIAAKYPQQAVVLAAKIRSGGSGVWGAIPMPAQSLSAADAMQVAQWLAAGAAP